MLIIISETFEFLVYRPPMNITVTISEALAGVTFYYIAATDGDTRILPDFSGSINFDTFSVVHMASQTSTFDISILKGTELIDGSQVSFTITVIGMLIIINGVISIIYSKAAYDCFAEEGHIIIINAYVMKNKD